MLKRILCLVLSLLLFAAIAAPAAAAQNDAPQVLYDLLEKFPHRAYWNHVGSAENAPDSVTDRPCPDHANCSWQPGACSCNSFSNAIQCMGFAYKAAYDLVGTDPRSWEMSTTLDASALRVGDVIRYRGNRHSLTVTGVRGDVISFVDCNWYPMCQIRWGSMELSEMPSFTYVLHDPANRLKNRNVNFFEDAVARRENTLVTQQSQGEYWTTQASVNLRKKPTVQSDSLCLVPQNTSVSVADKRLKNGYLWGQVTYGSATGWLALDYCKYVRGNEFAPKWKNFSDIQPKGVAFTLEWTAVTGAESYVVYLSNEAGNYVKTAETTNTKESFVLLAAGKYTAQVELRSTHAKSWVLLSEEKAFSVQNPDQIKLKSLKLSESSLALEPGDSKQLKLTVSPYCASLGGLQMKSDRPEVAEVLTDGTVKAKSCGKATVICSDQKSGLTATCSVRVDPAAPQGLVQDLSKVRTTTVTIKWKKVKGATGYAVYRKAGEGAFRKIAETEKNVYTDNDRANAKDYLYKVKAIAAFENETLQSKDSAVLTAATRPVKPENVKVTSSSGKITLTWTKNKRADRYDVFCSVGGADYEKVGSVSANKFTQTLKRGTKASYKVQAIKLCGEQAFASQTSDRKSVTVR